VGLFLFSTGYPLPHIINVVFLARRGLGSELQIPIAQLGIRKLEVPTGLFPGFNTFCPGFISGLFVFIPVLTCSSRQVRQLDPGKAARCGSSAAVPMAARYVTCKKERLREPFRRQKQTF